MSARLALFRCPACGHDHIDDRCADPEHVCDGELRPLSYIKDLPGRQHEGEA